MEEQSQTLVRLYFETREEAEATADDLGIEGFGTTIGRDLTGNLWSISVTGEEDRLQELAERIQRDIRESG